MILRVCGNLCKYDCLVPPCGLTIKRWFAEIVAYFERYTTNGTVEGIN
ncbi:transposase [Microseira sp. BLCC-F43]